MRTQLMKKLTVVLIFLITACASHQIRFRPDEVIYISEIVTAKDTGENSTLLSAFRPDGTQVKELQINGLMARMSPSQKQLVYIQLNRDPKQSPWDLVIADSNGRKNRTLQFLTKEGKNGKFVQDIAWSPDGRKLSILLISNEFNRGRIRGFQIFAFGFDPQTEKILHIHKEFCPSLEEPCYYGINWFEDSRRLLFYGSSGVRIIDMATKEPLSIINSPAKAHLFSNDNNLIAITAIPRNEITSHIRTYDLKTGNLKLQIPLDFYPQRSIASRDGHSILLQGKPLQEREIFMVELKDRQVNKMDIADLILLPMAFSPADNKLVACMGGRDEAGYGIYNLQNGAFLNLKKFDKNSPQGEKAGLSILLNRIDWFE